MRWQVHGERSANESDWMSLRLVDVEIPGGRRFEHHVVRLPCPAVGVFDRLRRAPSDRIGPVVDTIGLWTPIVGRTSSR
jgi:hypothetical protein